MLLLFSRQEALLLFLLLFLCVHARAESPVNVSKISVEIRSPRAGEHVIGADLWLDLSIHGVSVPSQAVGAIYLDDNRVGRLEASTARLDLEGVADLSMGRHDIRVVVVSPDEKTEFGVESSAHFIKSSEIRRVEFWDSQFDDDILLGMESECNKVRTAGLDLNWVGGSPPRGVTRIALGLPVLSAKFSAGSSVDDDAAKGLDTSQYFEDLNELPLFSHFIPTLRDSLDENEKFAYRIYFGYDVGDPLYDVVENRREITEKILSMMQPHKISVKWYAYTQMEGKVFGIYNNLFEQAYVDGSDYFYMVNDDLRLVTKGWARRYVDTLLGSPIHPNFGCVGPLDIRDVHKTHMTFGFHHRMHYELFGYFYPSTFPNWWADNWMSAVFGRNATFWLRDVQVHNTQCAGQRYSGFWQGQDLYADELRKGRLQVTDYCRCLNTGRRWRFGACADL